ARRPSAESRRGAHRRGDDLRRRRRSHLPRAQRGAFGRRYDPAARSRRMSLLLRAIVAAEDAGVAADLGLRSVSGTRAAALASAWDTARAAGEAELLDHHRIVQAVFERVPCLPARFGSAFADEEALRARLALRE